MSRQAHDDVVLRCCDLVKHFGAAAAVDGVSFEVARGETFGLLGPNGAGKTTTISMICGVLAPDAGAVTVEGASIGPRAGSAKAALGLVPQEIALYPELTARENLRFFGRLEGMSRQQIRDRSDEVLEMVGLVNRSSERIETYSGGMKRRVNIAVGLLHDPSVLILDEPTVGVDPQSRNQILESIERLSDAGLSVLYTTHHLEEADRLCDRIAIMDHGRIAASGTLEQLAELAVGRTAELGSGGATSPRGDLETVFLDLTGHTLRD